MYFPGIGTVVNTAVIAGSIQDGLLHDPNTLFAKAFLDFLIRHG